MNDILSVDLQKLAAECAELHREVHSLAHRMHVMTEEQKDPENIKSTETVRASMTTMSQNYNVLQRVLHKKMAEMSWCTQARTHNATVRAMPRGGFLMQERLPKTYESRLFSVITGSDGTPHLEFEKTRVVCCKLTLGKDKCALKFETSEGDASVGLPQLDNVSVFVPFRPKRVAEKAVHESKRARYESESEDEEDSYISGDTLESESESSEEESDSEDSFIEDSDEEEDEVMKTPERPRVSPKQVPAAPVKASKVAKRIVEEEEDNDVEIVDAPSTKNDNVELEATQPAEHEDANPAMQEDDKPVVQENAEPVADPSATPLHADDNDNDDAATVENGEDDTEEEEDEYSIPKSCSLKRETTIPSTQPLDIFA